MKQLRLSEFAYGESDKNDCLSTDVSYTLRLKQRVRMNKTVILVMQNWQEQLSHDIFYGILDFIADSKRTDIQVARIQWTPKAIKSAGYTTYKADGLIAPVVYEEMHRDIAEIGWKCVSTHIGISWPDMPQVDADHFATGRMAAQYFLDQGFESFAYVGDSKLEALRIRKKGFETHLQEAGKKAHVYEYHTIMDKPVSPTTPIDQWIQQLPLPTAIYCSADSTASDVLTCCQRNNIHVPDQIAILGTENNLGLCRSSHPSLSSIHIPYRKIGYEAMRVMCNWLTTGKMPPAETVLPPDFIEARLSTDTLAIEDVQVKKAIRLLREHCTEKISMDDIARRTGMSLRVMQSKFKQLIGHSPLTELHKARTEHVKQMLRETAFTLDEIAEKTGYPNANYLCEHFKKMTAHSPGEYRRATQQIRR